jgi:hypothetical protein
MTVCLYSRNDNQNNNHYFAKSPQNGTGSQDVLQKTYTIQLVALPDLEPIVDDILKTINCSQEQALNGMLLKTIARVDAAQNIPHIIDQSLQLIQLVQKTKDLAANEKVSPNNNNSEVTRIKKDITESLQEKALVEFKNWAETACNNINQSENDERAKHLSLWKNITLAATSKAKARKDAIEGINAITSHFEILEKADSRTNSVYPRYPHCAFKVYGEKFSAEEEYAMRTLFAIAGLGHIGAAHTLQNTSWDKLGFNHLTDIELRTGYTIDKSSDSDLTLALLKNISISKLIMKQLPCQKVFPYSFELGISYDSLEEEQLLDIANELKSLTGSVSAVPDFSLYPENFQTCYLENFDLKFKILNEAQQEVEVSFQQLQLMWLRKGPSHPIYMVDSSEGTQEILPLTHQKYIGLYFLIDVAWKIVVPEVLVAVREEENLVILPIKNAEVKSYIEGMKFFLDFGKYPNDVMQEVFSNPDVEDELITVYLAEFQSLDQHTSNLPLKLQKNSATEQFQNSRFDLPNMNAFELTLADLAEHFVLKKISSETEVLFYDSGNSKPSISLLNSIAHPDNGTVTKTYAITAEQQSEIRLGKIKDFKELHTALTSPWKLVPFDFDHSLAEDNYLQWFTQGNQMGHSIPLHISLLRTLWARTVELKPETITTLLDCKAREDAYLGWIDRLDSPIYLRLKAKERDALRNKIERYIQDPKYSFTQARGIEKDESYTLTDMRRAFADDLQNFSRHTDFWQFLEMHLKQNLTAISQEGENERYKIARSLFPNLTFRQKQALIERQTLRKEYLTNYQLLKEMRVDTPAKKKLEFLNKFIDLKSTPLSSEERKKYRNKLKAPSNKLLRSIESQLKADCKPTLANVTKSMYPLLADFLSLAKTAFGIDSSKQEEIWDLVGSYNSSIEHTIENYFFQLFKSSPNLYSNQHFAKCFKAYHQHYTSKNALEYLKKLLDVLGEDNFGPEKEALINITNTLFEKSAPGSKNPPSFFMAMAPSDDD